MLILESISSFSAQDPAGTSSKVILTGQVAESETELLCTMIGYSFNRKFKPESKMRHLSQQIHLIKLKM